LSEAPAKRRIGVTILGSTGSIGANTLDVLSHHRDRYQVVALTAHRNVERLSGVEVALSACSDLPVGVVTNGAPEMQAKKLETIGLDDAFDVVVHAGYETPAKPSSDPFEAALGALSARPDRSYYVGNSLHSDVAGANAAGMRSVWLTDADAGTARLPEPDHVVSGLEALPAVLTADRPEREKRQP